MSGTAVLVAFVGVAALMAALAEGWLRALALAAMMVAAVAFSWRHSVYGLLAVVFLTTRVVPVDSVDLRLPLGGGLKLPDLFLLGMLVLLVCRELAARRLVVPCWPVTLPLLAFVGLAVFSTLYSLLYQGVEANWALGELGSLAYYGTCLLTAWSLRDSRDRIVLLAGLFLIADVTVGLIIGQQFAGPKPLTLAMADAEWHVWAERTTGGSLGSVRVVPPAHVLLHLMMLVGFAGIFTKTAHRGWRLFHGAQFGFLSIGLVLAYTRAQWIAGAVGVGLILLVRARRGMAVTACVAAVTATGILGYGVSQGGVEQWKTAPLIRVLASRARSIFTVGATLSSYSLQWRAFEREEALRSISEHPVLGVGLGNRYREVSIVQGESHLTLRMAPGQRSAFTRYLHSSYLAIAVKMGLPALMCFLGFALAFLGTSTRLYRRLADDQARGLVLATAAAFVGLLGWSIFHSNFVDAAGACAIGLMVGLVARCSARPVRSPD